jgi:hypothetical protein
MPAQQAEDRGCNNGIAFNASQGIIKEKSKGSLLLHFIKDTTLEI